MENGTDKGNGSDLQKTSVYLPRDLNAVLRSRAKRRGVSIQDVIREALTTAMEVEAGGHVVEQVRGELEKQRAEIAEVQARLETLTAKGEQPPAAQTSEAA